jgi:hypothetical protein
LEQRIAPGEIDVDGGQGRPVDPRAILNAAWFFHSEGYPGWPDIRGGDLQRMFEKRLLLSRLVLKGVEISYLTRHWRKVAKGRAK